jgi:hypothetical protein
MAVRAAARQLEQAAVLLREQETSPVVLEQVLELTELVASAARSS